MLCWQDEEDLDTKFKIELPDTFESFAELLEIVEPAVKGIESHISQQVN